MIEELDLLIGLAMEAKETNRSSSAIAQKARDMNTEVSPKLRKDIIIPLMHSSNADQTLQMKCDDYFNRQRMRRGVYN
jgi:hypothetical protein